MSLSTPSQFAAVRSAVHCRLTCVCCSRTYEFSSDLITDLSRHQTVLQGYQLLEQQLRLSGICPECQTD